MHEGGGPDAATGQPSEDDAVRTWAQLPRKVERQVDPTSEISRCAAHLGCRGLRHTRDRLAGREPVPGQGHPAGVREHGRLRRSAGRPAVARYRGAGVCGDTDGPAASLGIGAADGDGATDVAGARVGGASEEGAGSADGDGLGDGTGAIPGGSTAAVGADGAREGLVDCDDSAGCGDPDASCDCLEEDSAGTAASPDCEAGRVGSSVMG